ncbi:hypothetical protein DM860_012604 [Cuscuta australis]|uniref:Uncharacterized protein n=1 Tax=Cuscuta australis TaxID=267555 RepID=A0A328DHI1_9ASTE|nr:hypothetical protein DM860_012604 [Cuscuta australis]
MMYCGLNLKGLFRPAAATRKLLKLFSTPFRLRRLTPRSKVIKKPPVVNKKNKPRPTLLFDAAAPRKTGASGWRPGASRTRGKRCRFRFLPAGKKRAAGPVYVDQLFVVPPPENSRHHHQLLGTNKFAKADDDQSVGPGHVLIRSCDENEGGVGAEVDAIWEAMVVSSPEMEGIDERAEAFISRFRAQMKRQ